MSTTEAEAIHVSDLFHAYRRNVPVLTGLDLVIPIGQIVALVGKSGAGKSTLLRCVNGLIKPTSGNIVVFGDNVPALSESRKRRVRRHIGMIFQEFNLVDRLTVLKNVLIGRLGYVDTVQSCLHLFSKADFTLCLDCLAQVGLSDYAAARVRDLSGGQKQRVAIARAMAQNARIILGDEATANLDLLTSEEIMSILVDLARSRQVTLLLSMHNIETARRYCDRIVGMQSGRIVLDQTASEVADSDVRGLLA